MAIGAEVFGLRAGPDMVAAIREGRFEYSDFAKAIAGGSDTIGKAAADTDDWRESLTLLKNKALVALEPALSAAFGGLSKAVDAAGKALTSGKAKDIFGGIADAFGVVPDKLAAAWRAIAPIVMPVLREWVQTTQIYMRRIMPIVPPSFGPSCRSCRWAWPVVKDIIIGALNVIAGVMRLVMALMRGDWNDGLEGGPADRQGRGADRLCGRALPARLGGRHRPRRLEPPQGGDLGGLERHRRRREERRRPEQSPSSPRSRAASSGHSGASAACSTTPAPS